MPQPPISIQPVFLHIAQPAPSHCQQLMSISALGSVYGKKLGRNRTRDGRREHLAREREQRALQIGERDAFADDQPFDLAERRRVRQVEIVAAVDAARARRCGSAAGAPACSGSASTRCACAAASARRRAGRDSPGIGVARYSVSCMSRAGCSAGMFSASKQCHSSSTSGPSTMAKPMRVKISSIRSRTMRERMAMAERRHAAGQRDVDGAGRPRAWRRPRPDRPSSALRSPASARWRSGRSRFFCSAGALRDQLHPRRRRRCSCGRGSGRGRPARRATDVACGELAPRTRRSCASTAVWSGSDIGRGQS